MIELFMSSHSFLNFPISYLLFASSPFSLVVVTSWKDLILFHKSPSSFVLKEKKTKSIFRCNSAPKNFLSLFSEESFQQGSFLVLFHHVNDKWIMFLCCALSSTYIQQIPSYYRCPNAWIDERIFQIFETLQMLPTIFKPAHNPEILSIILEISFLSFFLDSL